MSASWSALLVGSSARACLEETNEPGKSGEQGLRRCILREQTVGSSSEIETDEGRQVIYEALAVGAWRGGGGSAVVEAAGGGGKVKSGCWC
jgi:hypothetical protein